MCSHLNRSNSTFGKIVEHTARAYARATIGLFALILRTTSNQPEEFEITVLPSQVSPLNDLENHVISGNFLSENANFPILSGMMHKLLYAVFTGGVDETEEIGCVTDIALRLTALNAESETCFCDAALVGKLCSAYQYLARSSIIHEFGLEREQKEKDGEIIEATTLNGRKVKTADNWKSE